MIEPEVTAVLGRRLLAFLLDSSLVAATGLGTAFFTSTAFPVVGQDGAGKALVDPAEFETMRELLDFELFGQSEIFGLEVVRAQEFGDSVRIFGGSSYAWGLIGAAVAAVILFGIVPMFLKRTIGMLPFGIGIKSNDGTKAGAVAHLVRTLVGFVDAVPFVIPGLLGFVKAKGSPHRQRIGDRVAKTVVVDLKALALSETPREEIDLGLKTPEEDDDLSAPTPPAAPAAAAPATPTAPAPVVSPAASASTGNPASPADTAAAPRASEPTSRAESPSRAAADSTKPPVAKPTFGDPLPPPPVHRKAPSEHPLGTPSTRSSEDATTTSDESFQPASEVDAPTASAADHLVAQSPLPLDLEALEVRPTDQAEVPDDAWEPPREELAPVWQPTTLETAPMEAPNPHDGRTLDDLERIEPSIGALLADDSTDDGDTPTETPGTDAASSSATPADTTTSASTRPGKHSQTESSAKAPVWSDKWRAWMYWDAKKKCWLRHDAASNTWQPVG